MSTFIILLLKINRCEQNSFQTQSPRRAPTFGLIGRGTYARGMNQSCWLWVFPSLSSSSALIALSFIPVGPYCFFFLQSLHLLSLHCSLSRRTSPSPLPPSVPSLGHHPQASCVYILVVYFYKCQTVFLPSVYWSKEWESEGLVKQQEGHVALSGCEGESGRERVGEWQRGRQRDRKWSRNNVEKAE